jgi:hypothetical protein
MRKAGRTSAVTLQRYIDSAYDPDFDSLHSEETSDLDRWASELYGPQDVVMTSLRAPRSNMSLRNVSNELVKAPVTIDNDNRTSRLYQDSTYCSSTSASSYKEDNCTSSENMPAVLAAYSEQWRLQDTETTSFFDFRNDDDASRSASLSVKRPLAKRLWRRMASSLSLRASKVMSIWPQIKTLDTSLVDVRIIWHISCFTVMLRLIGDGKMEPASDGTWVSDALVLLIDQWRG